MRSARFFLPFVACLAAATAAYGVDSRSTLPAIVSSLPAPGAAAIERFYAGRGQALAWVEAGRLTERGARLAAELPRAAEENGLAPALYTVVVPDGVLDAETAWRVDVELTAALVRYARDVGTGALVPSKVDPNFALDRRPIDNAVVLSEATLTHDVPGYLAALQPVHPEYQDLKEALANLRQAAAEGGWGRVPDGPTLKPGMTDPRVADLRARLVRSGDLPQDAAVPAGDLYGGELVEAVRRFQSRHGLADDGVVGPRTLAALNVSASARAEQIVANMERLRWLTPDLGRRHIVVNVAGFTLRAVEDGDVVLRMPVIVGQGKQQTPLFSDAISYLDFNPYWNVPISIADEEIIPTLQRNPNYAIEQGIVIFDGHGQNAPAVSPFDIDWNAPGISGRRFRFQQFPGPQNPLGRVKFMFPNQFSVYLHDTSKPHLFDRVVRAMSHGCVRVGDPAALADFVLAELPSWSRTRYDVMVASGVTERIRPPEPVPVHLIYQTVWRDSDGVLQVRDDIYGRDPKVLRALKQQAERQVALDATRLSH